MKATIFSLLALLLVQTCAVAGLETDIPQTNRVILAAAKWQPAKELTQKALTANPIIPRAPNFHKHLGAW